MFELSLGDLRSLLQDVLAFTICIAALIWGVGPERIIAATWLLVFEIAGRIYRLGFDAQLQLDEVDPFLAGSDLVAGIVFIAVALYANRNYPLWIAGMQLLAMTAHLARGMIDVIAPIAYVTLVVAPGWVQLLILGAGLVRHRLREKAHGPYREWRGGGPNSGGLAQALIGNPRARMQDSAK